MTANVTGWRQTFDHGFTALKAKYQQLPSLSSLVPTKIQEIYKNSRVSSWSTFKKVGIGSVCVGGSFILVCLVYGRHRRNQKED